MVKKVKFQDLNRILIGRVTVAAYAWIYWCKKGDYITLKKLEKLGKKLLNEGFGRD